MSIKTAVRGDTPPLIHNKTQLLATAGGSPAKAVMRQTSHWINLTLNSPSQKKIALHFSYCLHSNTQQLMTFLSTALIENGTLLGRYCKCPDGSPGI